MNKHFYLKHEIMAFNDPRIQNMLRQEGGKAYGAYWYIMEKLSLLPDMEAELKYLVDHEWVRRADDALWRRTKQGMWLNADQQSRVSQWLVEYTQQKLSLAS